MQAEKVRIAQPQPLEGELPPYDAAAKRISYAIGHSLLKAKGPYRNYYRAELARLERERRAWSRERRNATALRKTEKLFLAHLWLVWRTAIGLPISDPHPHHIPGITKPDPWAMVRQDPERKREAITTGGRMT